METRDVLFVLRFETWEGAAWALFQPHHPVATSCSQG